MVNTLCLSGAVLLKSGANASTYFTAGTTSEARISALITQAESEVCVATRYNWIDIYGSLNVDVKYILESAVSNLAAMYVIQYGIEGYVSRSAETMLDVLHDAYIREVELLKDLKQRDFMTGA